MKNKKISIIILAAGKSTRMISNVPKMLHILSGKCILQHVIDTVVQLNVNQIYLVHGYKGKEIFKKISHQNKICWVYQKKQLGTGHAVKQVLSILPTNENVLILNGDVPFISLSTLKKLIKNFFKGGISLLTANIKKDNKGYGRIIRNKNGNVFKIIEYIDANKKQKKINEVNAGILVINSNDLKNWILKLSKNNKKNEFYLTDIINIASNEKKIIKTVTTNSIYEILGINNKIQLEKLERMHQIKQAKFFLLKGVVISDIKRFDLRGELIHGIDVYIDINVILEGKVVLGNRVIIESGCILKNVIVHDDVVIRSYSIIEESELFANSTIGPFARLRPGNILETGSKVGNFVEMKKTILGKFSKVPHLSYIGDAKIGKKVNIGSSTVTCNYDGINKNKTEIGNNVFIGCGTQLIAPVTIKDFATIGAGTTVTKNVEENSLLVNRLKDFSISNWKKTKK